MQAVQAVQNVRAEADGRVQNATLEATAAAQTLATRQKEHVDRQTAAAQADKEVRAYGAFAGFAQ